MNIQKGMTNAQIVASKWSGDLQNGRSNGISDWLTVPGLNEKRSKFAIGVYDNGMTAD